VGGSVALEQGKMSVLHHHGDLQSGGQSYRARAAKVSIIRFSHSNWTALKTLSLELL
jgi:hypothetical protein